MDLFLLFIFFLTSCACPRMGVGLKLPLEALCFCKPGFVLLLLLKEIFGKRGRCWLFFLTSTRAAPPHPLRGLLGLPVLCVMLRDRDFLSRWVPPSQARALPASDHSCLFSALL